MRIHSLEIKVLKNEKVIVVVKLLKCLTGIGAECHLGLEQVEEEVVSPLAAHQVQVPHLLQLLPLEDFRLVQKLQPREQEEVVSRLLISWLKQMESLWKRQTFFKFNKTTKVQMILGKQQCADVINE